jgi:hypothetical protein
MVTKLHGVLRREVSIKGRAYVVTLEDSGIKLTLKGHRKGQALLWNDFVSGDAALAVALNASLTQANDQPVPSARRATKNSRKTVTKKKTPARRPG